MGQTTRVTVRKVGVEEELLLVDPTTGEARPVSGQAMAADDRTTSGRDGEIEQELFLEQLETNTEPCRRLDDVAQTVRHGRWRADKAAADVGAAIAAVPTPGVAGPRRACHPEGSLRTHCPGVRPAQQRSHGRRDARPRRREPIRRRPSA